MIVIHEQAEERLYDALRSVVEAESPLRCIYMAEKAWRGIGAAGMAGMAASCLEAPDARIFICENEDVFILGAGISSKKAHALYKALSARSPGGLPEDADIFSLLDTRMSRMELLSRVTERIESRRARQKVEKERVFEEKRKNERQRILQMKLDEKLVNSITRRRRERASMVMMIIEDDFFSRTLVTAALGGKNSLGVITAENGEEAVRSYMAAAPDIVFLDIGLPDVSGHDVLGMLLKMDPQAFVVMLSGGGSRDNIMQAMAGGAKGFVVKPFTRDKLMQYIAKCPHRTDMEKDLV